MPSAVPRQTSATCFLILIGLKFTAVNVILVGLDVPVPFLRQIIQHENCRHRTDRHTGAAINALSGIDVQLRHFIERWSAIVIASAFRRMNTIHRAHIHTGGVFGSNARFSDDVCHRPAGRISPLRVYAHSFSSGRGAFLGTSCARYTAARLGRGELSIDFRSILTGQRNTPSKYKTTAMSNTVPTIPRPPPVPHLE